MNPFEETIDLLENGWCVSDLHVNTDDMKPEDKPLKMSGESKDKYCAVGALAAVLGFWNSFVVDPTFKLSEKDIADLAEEQQYDFVDERPEAKVLASAIIDYVRENGWPGVGNYTLTRLEILDKTFEAKCYSSIIYTFNDACETVEPVLEVMRYAGKDWLSTINTAV